jgi:hypothetical protein
VGISPKLPSVSGDQWRGAPSGELLHLGFGDGWSSAQGFPSAVNRSNGGGGSSLMSSSGRRCLRCPQVARR